MPASSAEQKNQEYHRIIVKDHFELPTNHNYDSILKILSLKKDQLENIIKDIKKLNPYPGEGKIKKLQGYNCSGLACEL